MTAKASKRHLHTSRLERLALHKHRRRQSRRLKRDQQMDHRRRRVRPRSRALVAACPLSESQKRLQSIHGDPTSQRPCVRRRPNTGQTCDYCCTHLYGLRTSEHLSVEDESDSLMVSRDQDLMKAICMQDYNHVPLYIVRCSHINGKVPKSGDFCLAPNTSSLHFIDTHPVSFAGRLNRTFHCTHMVEIHYRTAVSCSILSRSPVVVLPEEYVSSNQSPCLQHAWPEGNQPFAPHHIPSHGMRSRHETMLLTHRGSCCW